jgi:hypothetical protein
MVPLIEHRDRNIEDWNKETLDTKSPIQANAARRHHIPRPKRRVTNWSAYNEALRQLSAEQSSA